jgi:hypothetical protein
MKHTTEQGILDEVKQKLQQARQELDELTVQLALGKAEARDKFEEIKQDFLKRMHDWNHVFGIDGNPEVNQKIAALEEHLRMEEKNAKGTWDNRIKSIFASLEAVKSVIIRKIKSAHQESDIEHDVEIFKLKLEILRLKFGLKKFELKKEFHTRMDAAKKTIESVVDKVGVPIKDGKRKFSDFRDEAQIAYKHFRKALEALG